MGQTVFLSVSQRSIQLVNRRLGSLSVNDVDVRVEPLHGHTGYSVVLQYKCCTLYKYNIDVQYSTDWWLIHMIFLIRNKNNCHMSERLETSHHSVHRHRAVVKWDHMMSVILEVAADDSLFTVKSQISPCLF